MVKLVSFIVFTLGFIWTWFLFHSKSATDIGVHAGIQSKLALMIENTIKTAKPNAYNFQMISLYTKTLDENKISAYFSYRFSEKLENKESADQNIKGEAILNRTVSENRDDQKWVIQSVQTNNSAVEFHEGSVIDSNTADANASTPPDATVPAVTTAPADSKAKPEATTQAPPAENTEEKTTK